MMRAVVNVQIWVQNVSELVLKGNSSALVTNLNTFDWLLHSCAQQTSLWLDVMLNAAKQNKKKFKKKRKEIFDTTWAGLYVKL